MTPLHQLLEEHLKTDQLVASCLLAQASLRAEIVRRLPALKASVGLSHADEHVSLWWHGWEQSHRSAEVASTLEALIQRRASAADFMLAYSASASTDTRSVLAKLDALIVRRGGNPETN